MRRLTVGLLVATSVVFASGAFAADLPSPRYPTKAPYYSPESAFSWTGFYAGVNAGWGWSRGDGTATIGGLTGPTTGSGNGFLGGAQLGYNWQFGSFVTGLEADFDGSLGKGDVTGPNATTATAKTPWFGTARARLGYAFNRSMIYLTGGGVYGQSKLDGTSGGLPFSSSATYWSWTAGAGYEMMLWDSWSAKVEYLYIGNPSNSPEPPLTTALDGKMHSDVVRAGLNYHF